MDLPRFGTTFEKTNIRKMNPYVPPVKKHWQVGSTGMNTTYASRKNKGMKNTQGGGAYKIGDNVYFTLKEIGKGVRMNANPFIMAQESACGTEVRLYTTRDSWLRHNAIDEKSSNKLYVGTCNGWAMNGELRIQENSVFEVDEGEEGKEFEDDVTTAECNIVPFTGKAENNTFKPEDREHMVKVIAASHGCAWCSASLSSHPEHVIVNANTIICKDCKDLQDVKEYLTT